MTRQLPRIFLWHVLRDIRRHPLLALLNLVSVALGVAVYLAIQIANHSANRSFAASVDVVAGRAHLEARGDITDALVPVLTARPEVKSCTPVIEGTVTLPDFPGEYLQVLGVDVFTNAPFRTFEIRDAQGRFDIESWLSRPEAIAITREFGQRHGLTAGDRLRVLVHSVIREMRVVFLMDFGDSPAAANPRFAAMDIGWAQELFGMRGKLSSIQILLRDPAGAEAAMQGLESAVPPGVTVAPPGQRSLQIGKMLGAFELNLTALSMVSMLVGMFLIYNTISASVVRRRVEIGILRSLGMTRLEVRSLFLGEALAFGLAGIALGTMGGMMLAQGLVGSVAKTISSLYVLLSIDRNFFAPAQFLSAVAFGFLAVLVAAWVPAGEASRINPVDALSFGPRIEQGPKAAPRWFWLGVGSLVLAVVSSRLALTTRFSWLGFCAAFFVLTGFAMFAPAVVGMAGALFTRLTSGRVLARLASENLRRSVHRNSVTIAALAAAIAMVVAVSVMIFSFRNTVDAWIHHGIVADLFIAPASNEVIGLSAFVAAEAIGFLEAQEGIAAVDTFREISVTWHGESVSVAAIKGVDRRNLRFVGGREREKVARFFAGDAVIVTESLAQKFRVSDGDVLTLPTPRGPARFVVAGTYYDYTRDRGVIAIDRATFDQWWGDPRVQSLAVYLKPGLDPEEIAAKFRAKFGAQGEYSIYSNRALRLRILTIFDQTFAVTYVLRIIAITVAVAGILLSVTALVFERKSEIGVLRAIGAGRDQVRSIFLLESAMIGLIASALGLAAGACLAVVLTLVVNKACFGWTIALDWPWLFLATTPLWIISAATLAAWWPARRAGSTNIAEALRCE